MMILDRGDVFMAKKAMKKGTSCGSCGCCSSGCCGAWTWIILGALVVLNDVYGWVTWATFVGLLAVIYGLLMFNK